MKQIDAILKKKNEEEAKAAAAAAKPQAQREVQVVKEAL